MTDNAPTEQSFGTTKLYQITEDDLAELERCLPEICDRAIFSNIPMTEHGETSRTDPRLRVMISSVQRIIGNVRWNYGPPTEAGAIPG